MLAYARHNGTSYVIDLCSPSHALDKSLSKSQIREIALLDFLAGHRITVPTDPIHTDDVFIKLQKLSGLDLNRDFAIFDIRFSDSLKVDIVNVLTGFSPEVDSTLIAILKQARWIDGRNYIRRTQNPLPAGTRLLFAFYYYPGKEKYPDFISEFPL